ncbi:hypothetical protein THAOC_26286, partial [Thalassiosira oceanica]
MSAASALASGPVQSDFRAGIPSAPNASVAGSRRINPKSDPVCEESFRRVKQFEAEYGEDWEDTVIE